MTETTSAQPETTSENWPVLPAQNEIVVKCAALIPTRNRVHELMLQLLPEPTEKNALLTIKPVTIDGVTFTAEEVAAKITDFVTYCTRALTTIDQKRLGYTEKARKFVADMNAEVGLYTTPIKADKERAAGALLRFQQKQRDEENARIAAQKKKDEEAALAAAAKLEAEGNTEAANRVVEVAASAPAPVSRRGAGSLGIRGEMTGRKASIRTTWRGAIAADNVKVVLQAIIDGKLSADGISFSQAWLNGVATGHQKEEVYLGITCIKNESV